MNHIHSPLPANIRAQLFLHLAAMEKAGLSNELAFSNLKIASHFQERVSQTIAHLKKGKDIPTAGAKAGLFDELETQLLRAAVHAGSPAYTYQQLASRYALRHQLQRKVRSQLSLPIFIVILSLVLSVLPGLVSGTLGFGAAIWQIIFPFIIFFGLYCLGKIFYSMQPIACQRALLRIPIIGKLIIQVQMRNYIESLALMLEAGIPLLDALPKANKTVQFANIKKISTGILSQIKQGETLHTAMQACLKKQTDSDLMLIELINTGESSGTLPEMLRRFVLHENQAITQSLQEIAAWLPRIIYALVAAWIIYTIFASGAFMPNVPEHLL